MQERPSVRDVGSAQSLLVGTHLAVRDSEGRELGDPGKGGDDVHDANSAGLRVRTSAARGTNLEDDSDDVGSGVGDVHGTLHDVVVTIALLVLMALDLQGLVDRRRGPCRHELFPGRGDRLRACEDLEGILAEVAVGPGSGTHGGDLAEVGHQCCEVTSAQRTVVHGVAAGVCRERQVRGNPANGRDEACDAGSAAHRRVVWAFKSIVINGLVKEDDSLAQVCSSLHCVNYTFRADPYLPDTLASKGCKDFRTTNKIQKPKLQDPYI